MTKAAIALGLALLLCGCKSGSPAATPTAPTPPPAPPASTRIINVTGTLAFGQVVLGDARELSITIANSGNAVLAVRGMSVSGGFADHVTASWTSGVIAAGGLQTVTIRFSPRSLGSFTGTVTVDADHTSGTNTIAISGMAIAGFAGSWMGSYIVERCDGTGSVQDLLCSTQRGVFPPGSTLPIRINLTQSGNSVSGTVSFGQVTGPVNGVITADGVLTLQGTATGGVITAVISTWSTRVQGNTMTGNVTYNVTLSTAPGVGVLGTRLSGVTKQ